MKGKRFASSIEPQLRKLTVRYFKYILLFFLLPLLLIILLYGHMEFNRLSQEFESRALRAAQAIADQIDFEISASTMLASKLLYSQTVSYLSSPTLDTRGSVYIRRVAETQNAIQSISASSYCDTAMLFFPDTSFFISSTSAWHNWKNFYWRYENDATDILNLRLVQQAEEDKPGGVYWSDDGKSLFCIFDQSHSRNSMLGLRFSISAFLNLAHLRYSDYPFSLMMFAEDGKCLNSDGSPVPAEALPDVQIASIKFFSYEKGHYSVCSIPSTTSPLTYTFLFNETAFYDNCVSLFIMMAFLVLTALSMSLIASYLVAHKISQPYSHILRVLKQPIDSVDQFYDTQEKLSQELRSLEKLLYETRIKEYTMKRELLERNNLLRNVQRVALQAQINPHFLFNTLDMINWKVISKVPDAYEITGMIQDLSRLLHLSLATKEVVVPLGKELESLRLYLDLQAKRFEDKVSFDIRVPDSIMDNCMVYLSLQPLVENAISHGVKLLPKGGLVSIEGVEEPDCIKIHVTDNGPGIESEKLEKLNKRLTTWHSIDGDHIGLINVHMRFLLAFGPEYGLSLYSQPHVRTTVTLCLPRLSISEYRSSVDSSAIWTLPEE